MNTTYKTYVMDITLDCALGVVLGLVVNKISTYISEKLNLNSFMAIIVQLIIVINVLYLMKYNSTFLYPSWQGDNSHGIIFTSFFIGSQDNITQYLSYLNTKFNKQFN